ncbi:DinB family protein [Deinococcus sp. HMF7604]|uniref:DinB family protein n=1 Tax=Deinococcus betulae TaxID=2873312 RepID=UPI001CCEEE79|nr:DinB family protein [Deinococcus betulae]MBZ9752047.1 DinB family protein [Deinococcus betulae]
MTLGTLFEACRALFGQLLDAEFTAFMAALGNCPAQQFNTALTGHSPAWHALHIMDWTRATIQPGLSGLNPSHTLSYLGFEQASWVQAVYGPSLASEPDTSATILNALHSVFDAAPNALHHAPAERFSDEASQPALKKPRGVVDSLSYHLRHTAYHRGQVALVLKEFP